MQPETGHGVTSRSIVVRCILFWLLLLRKCFYSL